MFLFLNWSSNTEDAKLLNNFLMRIKTELGASLQYWQLSGGYQETENFDKLLYFNAFVLW